MRSLAAVQKCANTLSGQITARDDHVDPSAQTQIAERRAKPRIRQPFPTNVRGTDADGNEFELDVGLENISSSGLYLRMPRALRFGDELNLLITFSNGIKNGATASLLGRVLRVEPGVDGLNGIAMAIQQYEFV